ncbi:MAG: hypothetical protein WC249_04390 [Patescibacteria group bacterium]|jgi:hypothetical protein
MVDRGQKNRSTLLSWLDDYFNIVMIGVLFLFLFLAYWLVLSPKFLSVQDSIKTSLTSEEKLYASSQKKLAALSDINKVYEKIKLTADLQKFNTVLPGSYAPERLFGELEEIITTGGWVLDNISINTSNNASSTDNTAKTGKTNTVSGLEKINVTLAVSGINYTGFKRLLRILETNLRLMDISSVNFSPSNNTVNLNLVTYYYQTVR